MTRRIFAALGSFVLFAALGFFVHEMYQAGGLMEYTSFERTGHTQWKILFLLLSRLSCFPLFGLALMAWVFGRERAARTLGFLGVGAAFLNFIAMIVIAQEPW